MTKGSLAKRALLPLCALAACSDYNSHIHAFVAPAACGQGPYDVRLHTDGTTGADGLEVIACTPRRIAGYASYEIGESKGDAKFGDVADNRRCIAGGTSKIVTTTSGSSSTSSTTGSGGTTASSGTALVERAVPPMKGNGDRINDIVCPVGMHAQRITWGEIVQHRPGDFENGGDLHVRIWSDAPNDLSGVVFYVVHSTSKKSKQQTAKDMDKRQAETDREFREHPERFHDWHPPAPASDHGAPPAALAEARPAQPPNTTWVPGYWTWTGNAWGWVGGFWRDARVATPAPRVEVPGAPPTPTAVWIVGSWQLRGGSWVWLGGRWR
jgi:hypothetical protein